MNAFIIPLCTDSCCRQVGALTDEADASSCMRKGFCEERPDEDTPVRILHDVGSSTTLLHEHAAELVMHSVDTDNGARSFRVQALRSGSVAFWGHPTRGPRDINHEF